MRTWVAVLLAVCAGSAAATEILEEGNGVVVASAYLNEKCQGEAMRTMRTDAGECSPTEEGWTQTVCTVRSGPVEAKWCGRWAGNGACEEG